VSVVADVQEDNARLQRQQDDARLQIIEYVQEDDARLQRDGSLNLKIAVV